MAQKRMFDKIITNSDDFMNMPPTSQTLYFHLSMNADDDGFVNNWRSIMMLSHCTENDLKILVMKAYIVPFENGVIVIRHWRLNNFLRKDRYNPTIYQDEFNQLIIKDNGEYELKNDYRLTNGQPSIEKNSIEKNSIDKIIYIVEHLNSTIGANYKYNAKKTVKLINARLEEGFTVEDFKTVISKKARDWLGTDYEKFLRPETLFGTKFEGYLNEKERELTTDDVAKKMNWEEFLNE